MFLNCTQKGHYSNMLIRVSDRPQRMDFTKLDLLIFTHSLCFMGSGSESDMGDNYAYSYGFYTFCYYILSGCACP